MRAVERCRLRGHGHPPRSNRTEWSRFIRQPEHGAPLRGARYLGRGCRGPCRQRGRHPGTPLGSARRHHGNRTMHPQGPRRWHVLATARAQLAVDVWEPGCCQFRTRVQAGPLVALAPLATVRTDLDPLDPACNQFVQGRSVGACQQFRRLARHRWKIARLSTRNRGEVTVCLSHTRRNTAGDGRHESLDRERPKDLTRTTVEALVLQPLFRGFEPGLVGERFGHPYPGSTTNDSPWTSCRIAVDGRAARSLWFGVNLTAHEPTASGAPPARALERANRCATVRTGHATVAARRAAPGKPPDASPSFPRGAPKRARRRPPWRSSALGRGRFRCGA